MKINNLIYFLGPIYDKSKFEYLAKADICLLTSKFECNSMSALEVMKVGGILVATKECSLSDAGKYGAIKEVNSNLEDIYKNVRKHLLEDQKNNNILRKRAKLYVNKFHSTKVALEAFKEIYIN